MNHSHNAFLLLPHLRIQNYNAISSPLTWGAPAITGVMGFMHNLQRHIPYEWNIDLMSVGLVMHDFEPQVSGIYEKKFNLTRNPLAATRAHRKNIKSKDQGRVKTPGIIEEGRAHATVSLLFGIWCKDMSDEELLQQRAQKIYALAQSLRFVGGSVLPIQHRWLKPRIFPLGDAANEADYLEVLKNSNSKQKLRAFKNSLLPGFALISRDDLFKRHAEKLRLTDPSINHIDVLLDLSRINYSYQEDEGKQGWYASRQESDGWLVPIPVGFTALSKLYQPGEVVNSRDPSVPFRFVESLYSMGEWISPHRVDWLEDLLWVPFADHEQGIYRCIN